MLGALNRLGVEVRRGLSKFAVGSKEPALGFDFVGNDYVANGTKNLSQAITHSRSGNATMTDGYGPELVTNGDFSTDSDWTLGTGWSIADGVLSTDGSMASYTSAQQNAVTVSGKMYVATFKLDMQSGALDFKGSGVYKPLYPADSGFVTVVFQADSANVRFTTNSAIATIDNVSVREMPVIKWAPHNLLTYSEDFSNAAWNKYNSTVTSNSGTAPNGSATADLLTATAGSATHQVYVSFSSTSGIKYTMSVFLKKNTQQHIQLLFFASGFGISAYANFDIENGTVGSVGGSATATITDAGNSYYKVDLEAIATSTAGAFGAVNFIDSSTSARNETTTTDGTESIYIWGAHVYRSDLGGMVDNPERGDSYVPTTTAAKYLPRVGHHVYNGYEWVNEGMLHESESRTNLITYSEDFTDASWTKGSDAAALAIDAIGPDGQVSAVTLIDDNSGGSGTNLNLLESVTVATSTNYTLSVFAKADGLSWLNLTIASFTTPATSRAYFDLANGVEGTVDAGFLSSTIESFGNGWYRCSVTFTTDVSDTSGQIYIAAATANGNVAVDLDGTSSILIYGAQFEQGSTPSSYIPTSGSTVTRAADSLVIPSANLPWPTPQYIGDELQGDAQGDNSQISGVYSGAATSYIALTNGSVYRISVTISNYTAGLFDIGDNADRNTIVNNLAANGTYVYYFVPDDGTLYFTADANSDFTLDVSVREINPLSVSIQMDGRMTYADNDDGTEVVQWQWYESAADFLRANVSTAGSRTGQQVFYQKRYDEDLVSSVAAYYSPSILVPYNIASRHGSTFINAAIDGTALTANTTPTSLPDLSATDLDLAPDYMGTINQFRVWSQDLGDTGIVDATEPSLEPSLSLTFDSTDSSFIVRDFT